MTPAAGLLFHPRVDRGLAPIVEARRRLEQAGLEVWDATRDDPPRRLASLLRRSRLLVTLGGDGTLLNAVRLAAPHQVPVLGVNLGRLGFLTEVEPDGLPEGVDRFLAGEHWIEERTLLHLTVERGGRLSRSALGLNEAVVQRSAAVGLMRMEISVNGQEVGTIDADGAIVATASGSTAYALAAGGPILAPDVEDLVLVPMSPFALTVRPIVFPPGQPISIRLRRAGGRLSVDGARPVNLRENDLLRFDAYPRRLRMVRFAPPERFYGLLRQKLGWGLPLVPTPDD